MSVNVKIRVNEFHERRRAISPDLIPIIRRPSSSVADPLLARADPPAAKRQRARRVASRKEPRNPRFTARFQKIRGHQSADGEGAPA